VIIKLTRNSDTGVQKPRSTSTASACYQQHELTSEVAAILATL